jgi:hypothetical protein
MWKNVAAPLMSPREGMMVYQINPLQDSRWARLVESHPKSTVFHTAGWLEALCRTYGYEPVVLTTTGREGPLKNGLLLCKVSSWLTGTRLVSLAFSDHCQPLVNTPSELLGLLKFLENSVKAKDYKYVEIRPPAAFDPDVESGCHAAIDDSYYLHLLDLRPPLEVLFKGFHKSCVQRKLERAKREDLKIEEGRSEKLLRDFYRLLVMTRRRHHIPPQPFEWFQNLIEYLGDQVVIRMAFKEKAPIASIFTLTHKKTVVYKYGCSDSTFHNLGGMLSLFWRTIQVAKEQGFEELDLGRSEVDNQGLIAFKDRWGSTRTSLRYYRYPWRPALEKTGVKNDLRMEIAQQVLSGLPDFCLVAAGKLLYRHIG